MNAYETQNGWVLIAVASDNIWPRVCQAVDAPEWLDDPRFRTRADRDRAWQALEAHLQQWFAGRTREEAVAIFSRHGIPFNSVNDIPTAAHEPQLHERELLVEVPDPIAGRIHVSGKHIKLSRSEVVVGSAPVPGQHTEEILTQVLHYKADKLEALEAAGAVYRGKAAAATATQ